MTSTKHPHASRRKPAGACGLLTAAVLAAVLPTRVAEAQTRAAPYPMPPVVVGASRLPGELSGATRDALVLGRQDIAARRAGTLAELLATLPGIDLRTRGPEGVQADLEMDGSTFGQVLILVDGVRVNDPQTGHHNLNLPLGPADLERVEVLYGAGAAVHGAGAMGGVINLVPRRRAGPQATAAAHWGEVLDDGAEGLSTEAGLRWGRDGAWGSVWVTGAKRRSDGYRQGTGFDENRGFLHARLPMGPGELSLQAGVQDKAFGARDFYAPYPSREWTTAQTAAAAWRAGRFEVRAYGRRHRDRFVLIAADPAVYDNRHRSLLAGIESHGALTLGGGELVVGGEAAREAIDSNNLGDHSRLRGSLFGEFGRHLGQAWVLTAGLRVDHHEGFGTEASPSAAIARAIGAGRVYLSAARAYRAPSFTEIHYSDPANVGDPDLGAERAWQYEAGGALPVAGTRLEGALFLRRESELIDYVRPAETPPWQATNLGEMQVLGLRLRARRAWRRAVAEAGFTWVDKEQTLAAGLESKYVFAHPVRQLSARLHHDLPGGASAEWDLQLRDRLAPLDSYGRLDLSVGLPFAGGQVLLRVRNLSDERYEAVAGVPMPGRWFALETRVDL